jgi:tetraacyldisaccharide 4'-kinase
MKSVKDATSGWPIFWHQGKQPPWWAKVLEALYCVSLAIKRWAYRVGLKKVTQLPVPVVVVGNRVVGGTGKTPLLMALIPQLQAQGWRVGIISRGYGRSDQAIRCVDEKSSSDLVGDEPLLLWQSLQVPVWVGSQRVEVARALLNENPVDLIVSDDGWQHWALDRDVVIEVIDEQKGYGNGHCLPAGPLREMQNALPLPDLTLYNGRDFSLKPTAWQNVKTRQRIALTELTGSCVAMAGIGHPQRFFDSLTQLDLKLNACYPLSDHQSLDAKMLAEWDDGVTPLLMTMKDAVRCQDFAQLHWWALVVETECASSLLQPVMEQLSKQLNNMRDING